MAGTQGRCLPVEGQEFAVAGWAGRQSADPDAPTTTSRRIPARATHRIASHHGLDLRCDALPRLPRRAHRSTRHSSRAPETRGQRLRRPAGLVAGGCWCNAMQCRAERTYTDAYYRCLRTTYATTGDQTSRPAPHRTARILFCSDLLSCPARVLVPCLLTSSLGAASHHHGCPLALATCH